jgi:glycosyltransferase involved in cell wall biosynthesis
MINTQYVLFNSIPILKDPNGRFTCDPFWAKELRLHIDYIAHLTLCCPVIETNADSDMELLKKMVSYNFGELEDITDYRLKIIPQNHSLGWFAAFKNFIPNFFKVKNALTPNCIAHSDGAGWPFPISFYLLPLKWFYKFKWVMIVESTFWMVNKGDKFNLIKSISHFSHKLLIPLCLKAADARIFTHEHYKNIFLGADVKERVHIAQYSNLDSEYLISEEAVLAKLETIKTRKTRFILAGRLIAEKGIHVLLEAIQLLRKQGVAAQIDIMGSGPLEQECRDFAKLTQGSVEVAFVEPVPYGPAFFKNLATYDVLLLTNLTEEQPRIVFDAFGQGLTIVASDTDGLKTICKAQENAIIFKTGDVNALADAISYAVNHQRELVQLGLNGLRFARTKTHQQMHQNRAAFLLETVAQNESEVAKSTNTPLNLDSKAKKTLPNHNVNVFNLPSIFCRKVVLARAKSRRAYKSKMRSQGRRVQDKMLADSSSSNIKTGTD